jgi:hypothetical protein
MTLKSQKRRFAIIFSALLLISLAGFFFAFVRWASAGAGIHTPFVHTKLTDDERLFIYSVMREQLLQVSTVLGVLAFLWAAFAVVAWRLWRRASERSLQREHTTGSMR